MRLLLFGLMIAAFIFIISGGHILFLPLLFLFPLGIFRLGGRRNHRRRGMFHSRY